MTLFRAGDVVPALRSPGKILLPMNWLDRQAQSHRPAMLPKVGSSLPLLILGSIGKTWPSIDAANHLQGDGYRVYDETLVNRKSPAWIMLWNHIYKKQTYAFGGFAAWDADSARHIPNARANQGGGCC